MIMVKKVNININGSGNETTTTLMGSKRRP
jgi:hypothetical protein